MTSLPMKFSISAVTDLNTIHEENDVIGPEELARAKAQLKWGKHTYLIMRMEHPRAYQMC